VIRDARDALDLVLGVDGAAHALVRAGEQPVPAPATLEPRLMRLLAAIEDGHDTVSALVGGERDVAAARAGLVELELLGLVQRIAGGRVRRAVAYEAAR
jgi:DNA processing protein